MLLDLLVKAPFDLQIFDHGFDNQITVFQLCEVIFEISHSNQ